MADNTDDILFTGGFDPSEITDGIDAMIAATKKLEAEEAKLQKELADTEAQLKKNREELNKTVKAQQAGDKTAADYASRMKALAKQADDLRIKNEQLNQTIIKQKAEVTTATQAVEKMKTTYTEAGKAVEGFNKEGANIGASISGNKLFGKLGEVKDKVGDITKDIAGDLASGGDIQDGLSSLGASFGVFGAVAVAALGPLLKKFFELATAQSDAEKVNQLLIESERQAGAAFAEAAGQVQLMTTQIDLAKAGFLDKDEVVKQYNETIGKTTGLVKDIEEAEAQLIAKGPAFIELMFLKAKAQGAYNAAVKEAEKAATAEIDTAQAFDTFDKVVAQRDNLSAKDKLKQIARAFNPSLFPEVIVAESDAIIKKVKEEGAKAEAAAKDRSKSLFTVFDDIQKEAAAFAFNNGLNFFGNNEEPKKKKELKDKAARQTREIVNIYEQELQKLLEAIAKLNASVFTDEATITKAVEEDFKKRALALDKAFKKGQLTSGQLKSLQNQLNNLQDLTLEKDLKEFSDKQKLYLQKIEDELTSVRLEAGSKRIAAIQNNFERERQSIEQETDKTQEAVRKKRDKVIADLQKDAAKNGQTQAAIQPKIDEIVNAYGELLDNLEVIKNQRLQKLSFDTFEKLSEDAKRMLDAGNLGISEGSLINIQEQTALFTQGKISYKEYQKEITKIARFEREERFRIEKLFLDAEIKIRQEKIKADKTLTDDQIKRLNDEITALRARLAAATAANEKAGVADINSDKGKNDIAAKLQQVAKYAQAVGSLAQSVIGFWAQMNQAEQAALDRSIAIQERRVEAARRVAERGNAEYLRLEEDRMNELEVKRENAARRQLAINAALQASQVVTALISGIAQGASTGGALGAIIGLTAIVGAIASGFAIAKSLQPQEPSFFVGTEDTGKGGKADNKGGFRAVLHPHERVITREQNKQLKGISNEELVKLVNTSRYMIQHNYPSKPTPQLNLAAMDMANNVTATHGIKLAGIMEENNRKLDEHIALQKTTNRLLKNMGVNVNVDRNGFAISVMETAEQIEKDKRA